VLCLCASLFACSDEKDPPTHADLCKKGASVECLLGQWRLDYIEKQEGNVFKPVEKVSGRLTLESLPSGNIWYEFEKGDDIIGGILELNVNDSKITVGCPEGYLCAAEDINENSDIKIELYDKGDILRIYGSPFFNYGTSTAIEKYIFM